MTNEFATELDNIYHSESPEEMKIKADMYNIDLNDIEALKFLIETTTYHAAFWPHTKNQFKAFLRLLKNDKTLTNIRSKEFIRWVENEFANLEYEYHNNPIYRTPGRIDEISNYGKVLNIISPINET